ncbi:hypothetical protein KBY66_11650 [Synechococcus sp. Tobar12-5m-g]|uniref:hypothetical protein n=1 Tax=unclassified Synechococcus TaxID=2626047 RepID=UPI0020CD4EB3|nr:MULTISPECIES: hypothetical protein [unclassified Synechococcus]MCP9773273.1 hypothetical protein [Synechococcus sp. Tobar12-5m-g]
MIHLARQQPNTLIPTHLHWQANGELHPEDVERLSERLLADQTLDEVQLLLMASWVIGKQQQAA